MWRWCVEGDGVRREGTDPLRQHSQMFERERGVVGDRGRWHGRRGSTEAPGVLSPTVAEYTQVGCPIMQDCVCGAFQPFLSRF